MADPEENGGGATASNPTNDRITQLSDKVKDEGIRADTAAADATAATKRAEFAEGFVEVLGSYPAAKEFKADIQTKVNAGYTVEDATLAVLGKAGKLGGSAPVIESVSPAGGSSPTVMPQTSSDKSVSEMTTAEKREALSGLSPQEAFSAFRSN